MEEESKQVKINPQLMRFVIDNSGYSIKEIIKESTRKYVNSSKKIIFDENYLLKVVEGKEEIDLDLLLNLDKNLFKRGLPFYFLNFIPEEKMVLNFRKNSDKLSAKDRIILRKYQSLRYYLKELMENLSLSYERKIQVYSKNQDPKIVAKEIRSKFGFDNLNLDKKNSDSVFKILREKIEDTGLFVFKTDAQSMDRALNISGCIFLEGDLPSLILLKNQGANRNVFTLLHEFAHYLISEGEDVIAENENDPQDVEWWCNTFASYFILPEEKNKEFLRFDKKELIGENYSNLKLLSDKYKLSKLALMWRFYLLKIINFTEFIEYKSIISNVKKDYGDEEIKIPRVNLVMSTKSKSYLKLLSENLKKGEVSTLECREKLNLRNDTQLEEVFAPLENA